jgi:DNA (cytosine-5)-methyltransferase 1
MGKPKILDTFACAGAAGTGYQRAGFDVYAVELDPVRAAHNPFPVHVGDALAALRTLIAGGKVDFVLPDGRRTVKVNGRAAGLAGDIVWLGLEDFTAAHGSPPCQGYTRGNAGKVTDWPKLIPDVRDLFEETGLPYVIENVKDAGPEMKAPAYLCGCMFDLTALDDDGITLHLQRARLFETSFGLEAPRPCDHSAHEWVAGAYGGARRDKYEAKYVRKGGYVPPNKAVVAALLGIDHPMTWIELFEAIPPAYTEYVGAELLKAVKRDPR